VAEVPLAWNRRLYVIMIMKSDCITEIWDFGPVAGPPGHAPPWVGIVSQTGIGAWRGLMKEGNRHATL
jgi:hypothetical protein